MIAIPMKMKSQIQNLNNILAIGLAFVIPLSNSATTGLSLSLLASCFFLMDKKKVNIIFNHPVSKSIFLLFIVYCLGAFYSDANISEIKLSIRKISRLLFIPLLIPFFSNRDKVKKYILYSYLAANVLSIGWAYKLGVESVFKDRIFTSLFVAFAMFLSIHLFSENKNKYLQLFYLGLACFFGYYLYFISTGRSGQTVGLGLIVLCLFQRGFSYKKLFILIFLFLSLLFIPNSFVNRYQEVVRDLTVYYNKLINSGAKVKAPETGTSSGLRAEFALNSLLLFKEKPFLGWGTGAFKKAYTDKFITDNNKSKIRENPHNQYLWTIVELGSLGLLALSFVIFNIFKKIYRQKNMNGFLAVGLLFSLLFGNMANSWFMDFASSNFFAFFMALFLSGLLKSNNLVE